MLLFLPSADAFSAGVLCRALREQTADGQGTRRLWQDLLGDRCKGLQRGGCLWLHALVPALSIKEFAPFAGRLRATVPVVFRSASELAKATSAVRASAGPGSVFFAAWDFQGRSKVLSRGVGGQVLSRSQHFRSEDGVRIGVRLTLIREDVGELTLGWRLCVEEDALEEVRDCRVELSGQVLLGVAGGDVLPSIRSFGVSQAKDVPASRLREEGDMCTALLRGAPLVCSLRIRSWSRWHESVCETESRWGSFSVAAEP